MFERAIPFAIIFVVLGITAHAIRNSGSAPGPAQTVVQSQVPQTPTEVSNTKQISTVSFSKIWPEGATPTKIIHIPDLQEPMKGLMEINLQRGDDLEFEVDPLWTFKPEKEDGFSGVEVQVNDGQGFQAEKVYIAHRDASTRSTNAFWTKQRVVRMRLAPNWQSASFNLIVEKYPPPHPLPPVPPQTFDRLVVSYGGIHGLPDGSVLIYLNFKNTDETRPIAVAMHDEPCETMPCTLASELVCSDGTPYEASTTGLTGINGLRTSPGFLTSIEPGEELKTSLKFRPQGNVAPNIKSVRFLGEVVVNPNYRSDEYSNYRESGSDVLPPYCKIISVEFDIPLRE